MKQYWDLKSQDQCKDAMLFFRMGDFYELFAEDAIEASRILEITLTTRDKNNKVDPVMMAGFPHHSAQPYIQKLLEHGKKVAIGEQVEDPSIAASKGPKAIVKREIVRVFTPAIQFENEGSGTSYLATAISVMTAQKTKSWILACLDASTGEAKISSLLDEETLLQELSELPIKHFLRIAHDLPEASVQELKSSGNVLFEELPSNYLSQEQAVALLKRQYGIETLDAFVESELTAHALGIIVNYAIRTQQQERLAHLKLPAPLHQPRTMKLGPRSIQHLDLLPAPDGTPSLFQLINKTKSALGARQLKRWLIEPLKIPAEIERRQKAVRELSQDGLVAERLSAQLGPLYDLERIMGRINAKLANPRDTLALGKSLALIKPLIQTLSSPSADALKQLKSTLTQTTDALTPLAERILKTQKDDAPFVARDGGIFETGTTPELDRLISLTEDGQRWLIDLETKERETTGITSLKVRYNRVFGYYIEVTQSHLKKVPPHYQRKQSTVGAERFFTDELKKFEEEILTASSKQKSLEQELFEELTRDIQIQTAFVMEAAQALAELDSLISFSKLAMEPGWIFPSIDDSMDVEIIAGRHPLVDASRRGQFVPNDLTLSAQTKLTLLITGPNMGGKSTVMRQAALIAILGQAGAPIPAQSARWGAFSSIYTRIGAHDAISRGQSTFMVEMSELAHILHNADEHSLVILDEIGRGTSTYDGISVAWSTLEWICNRIQCRTLFATHYHELTRLPDELPLLANAHMAVEGTRSLKGGSLRFMYLLKDGPANESFGIHVARLAGLPSPVVARAWSVLEMLEASASTENSKSAINTSQLSLFDAPASPAPAETSESNLAETAVLEEIKIADFNQMTPIQALTFLSAIKTKLAEQIVS